MANPNLEMWRSDTLVEVGTAVVPIDFGLCDAGDETLLAYDILLYNDKTGVLGSEDAKSIEIELLRMYSKDYLEHERLPLAEPRFNKECKYCNYLDKCKEMEDAEHRQHPANSTSKNSKKSRRS